MLDDKIIEDLILWECTHDEDYWKNKKKHHFSIRYRRKHRKYMRELHRRGIEGEPAEASQKMTHVHRTGKRFARVAAAACIAVAALTVVHVTAKNVHLEKLGNSRLQDFDDHVQFSEEGNHSKILKGLDEKQRAGEADATITAETVFEKKVPQYLPEGYELTNEIYYEDLGCFRLEYTDHDEQYLYYRQCTDMYYIGFSSDEKVTRNVQINGLDGFFTSDQVTRTLIWNDDTYYYCLSGNIDDETLLEIAVNVN